MLSDNDPRSLPDSPLCIATLVGLYSVVSNKRDHILFACNIFFKSYMCIGSKIMRTVKSAWLLYYLFWHREISLNWSNARLFKHHSDLTIRVGYVWTVPSLLHKLCYNYHRVVFLVRVWTSCRELLARHCKCRAESWWRQWFHQSEFALLETTLR